MPANMMIEPAGSSLKVIGNSSATVSAGPIPGSPPTAVPRTTPISAKSRFIGWIAMLRPCARERKEASMELTPSEQALERAHGQGQRKELGEDEVDHNGEDEPDRQFRQEGITAERGRGRGEQDRGAQDEP